MATLSESATWVAGIYQLETTDPVLGGPDGIDNLQAKQLANRTAWLKYQVESLGNQKQPLDATLTALAGIATAADRLIYAAGEDSFATTSLTGFIRTLLDDVDQAAARATLGAAAIASPAFSGTPTAPTAAPGTNSQQLANTAFVQAAIAALVASSPAALDTLNELAAALGNDPNFAATITNALALKAPLASPALTGSPTAPTAAKNDNSTALATTAYALGMGLRSGPGLQVVQSNTTLLPSSAGNHIVSNLGTGAVNVALPLCSSVPAGTMYIIEHNSAAMSSFAVGVQGADTLVLPGTTANLAPYVMAVGEVMIVENVGATWKVISGSGAKVLAAGGGFASLMSATGYQKLPSGLIIQWGAGSSNSSGQFTATFPIAFPNAVLNVLATPTGISTPQNYIAIAGTPTLTSVPFFTTGAVAGSVPGAATIGLRWLAIGY